MVTTITITDGKTLNVPDYADVKGTNTGDITLSGETYLSLTNQALTANKINLATHVTGSLPTTSLPALTGDVTSVAGSSATTVTKIQGTTVTGTTGSGNVVLDTSPTLTTPTIGVASATSLNKVTVTAPATSATLTIDDGTTLHATGNVTALSGSHTGTSSGTNTGDQTITLTGDVTGSGTGSFAATIANNAVTNAKLDQMPANTIKGNNTGSLANSTDLSVASVSTMLGLGTAATRADAYFLQTGNNLSDVPSAGTARTNLGLGTVATQNAGSVAITGGTITGITDIAVADGGTGVSTLTPHGVLIGAGTAAVSTTSSGTAGQVLTSNGPSANPTFQNAGGFFTQSFTSSDLTITAAGTTGNIAHGLGAVPKMLKYELICQTAEFGYSAGQIMETAPGAVADVGSGFAPVVDATNINIRFGNAALGGTIVLIDFSTGQWQFLTNANWKLRVTAFA